MTTLEQKAEIEEFLSREALLLDEYRYEKGLALFTDDIEYLVPLRERVPDNAGPAGHPIIKDDKLMLRARIMKDATGMSHVEIPRSMTTHLVSNVVMDGGPNPGEVTVRSAFLVRQARKLRDEAWWVGRRTDLLRRVDGEWKI